MVDWKSPAIMAEDSFIFLKLMHAFFGAYAWEWFITLDFDWLYLSGKRKLRYPMVFYFLNRYFLLFTLIALMVTLNVTHEVNCQVLYTISQFFGTASIGLVSINLSIRTMAVWGQPRYIVIPLIILILGHWGILLRGIVFKSVWDPQVAACVITNTNPKILWATFLYSMAFDFILLCLTGYKLHILMSSTGLSRLATLIFHDGLVYFIVVFLSNLVAVTFLLLDLNPVMSIITSAPACVISTTVVCRAIRRLANYSSPGADVYHHDSLGRQSFPISRLKAATATPSVSLASKGGVQIQMQTYQQYENSEGPDLSTNEYKSQLSL